MDNSNFDINTLDFNSNNTKAELNSNKSKSNIEGSTHHHSYDNISISFSDNNSLTFTDQSAESSTLNSMKSFTSSDTEMTGKTEIIFISPSDRIIEDINVHVHGNDNAGSNPHHPHNISNTKHRWSSILRSKSTTKEHVKVPLEEGLAISLDKKENEKDVCVDVNDMRYEYDSSTNNITTTFNDQTTSIPAGTHSLNVIIDENHDNYVLMYDMLTGIRTCVSRCEAKPWRALQEGDFCSTHKLAFDLSGGDETPSSRYDFKFKDYSPWVFRSLREAFLIDAADYLVSLTSKYVLSELYSPGKSGSLFYYSQDYRFIIKTIRESEHLFLRKILPKYYQHMKDNYKNTMLVRIYGLHRVQVEGKKIYFVVMGNIFPSTASLRAIYDLKGSTQGRWSSDELRDQEIETDNNNIENINVRSNSIRDSLDTIDPNTNVNNHKLHGPKVLKDLNWLSRRENLVLGPIRATELMTQLKIDCKFLAKLKIMDYSLLIGLRDCCRDDDDLLSVVNGNIPFTFYKDFEGFRSSYQDNSPGPEIYYLGIIDILTPYSTKKRLEHFFKSIVFPTDSISAVNPINYAKRFLKFMNENILQNVEGDYNRRELPRIPECEVEKRYNNADDVNIDGNENRNRDNNNNNNSESDSDFIIVNLTNDNEV